MKHAAVVGATAARGKLLVFYEKRLPTASASPPQVTSSAAFASLAEANALLWFHHARQLPEALARLQGFAVRSGLQRRLGAADVETMVSQAFASVSRETRPAGTTVVSS